MWHNVHTPLSRAQSVPIFGVIPSTLKALIGSVQFVVGLAFGILFGLIALITRCGCCKKLSERAGKYTLVSFIHAAMGLHALLYSVGNIATLGGLAYSLRRLPSISSRRVSIM